MGYGTGGSTFSSLQKHFSDTSISAYKGIRSGSKTETKTKESFSDILASGVGVGLVGMEIGGLLGGATAGAWVGPVGFGVGALIGIAASFF